MIRTENMNESAISVNYTKEVYEAIRHSIGARPAESGGMLGTSDGGKTIDHFYFDNTAVMTANTYSPDIATLNRIINQWDEQGVRFCGIIHSHPLGSRKPSHEDVEYAQRILENMELPNGTLYTPIVQVESTATHSIRILHYAHRIMPVPQAVTLPVNAEILQPTQYCTEADQRFDRISSLYPLAELERKTVICIGTGGARSYLENLARSGVTRFILFEKDVVSGTNIGTQAVYISEIGMNKGVAIKNRILDINPNANVSVIHRFVNNDLSDENFANIVGENLLKNPLDYLIAGCTDNFPAQARSAALAMKFGTPYIAVQLYQYGEGSELYFSYPGVTRGGCPRCALGSRYDAYLNHGATNDITSAGTPIWATERTNALKGDISMALLLYHVGTPQNNCCYYHRLDAIKDRNFVMIRMNPSLSKDLGMQQFDTFTHPDDAVGYCYDDTLWFRQWVEDGSRGGEICPLCHGDPDLRNLVGKIEDTRILK